MGSADENAMEGKPRRADTAALVLVLAAIFVWALSPLTASDFWTHMAYGREAVSRRTVPKTDLFTYTAEGRPWINHAWLMGVVYYVVHGAGGVAAIILLKGVIVCGAFLFVYLACRSRDALPVAAVAATALAAGAVLYRMIDRPFIVSWLMLALVCWRCHSHERHIRLSARPPAKKGEDHAAAPRPRGVDWRWQAWNAVIFLLWANLHVGFLVGIGILGAHALGGVVELVRTRGGSPYARYRSARTALDFTVACIVCGLVTLVNPFGLDAHLYPLLVGGRFEYLREILEWRSPTLHRAFWGYWVFFVVALLTCVLSLKRLTTADIVKIVALGAMSLKARRHGELFAIACAPTLARQWSALWRAHSARLPGRVAALAGSAGVRVAIVVLVIAGFLVLRPEAPSLKINPYRFPEEACAFLKENPVGGRLFNDYGWGGYLTWVFYPDKQVFIDGRNDVCGSRIYSTNAAIRIGQEDWRQALDHWGVNLIILNVQRPESPAHFFEAGDWVLVYRDDKALVAVRKSPQRTPE